MIKLDEYLNESVASGRKRNLIGLNGLDPKRFNVKLFSDYLEQHGIPKFPESTPTDSGRLLWEVCDSGYLIYEAFYNGRHVYTTVKVMDPTEPVVYYVFIDAKTQKVEEVGKWTKSTQGKYREDTLTWEEFLSAMNQIGYWNG